MVVYVVYGLLACLFRRSGCCFDVFVCVGGWFVARVCLLACFCACLLVRLMRARVCLCALNLCLYVRYCLLEICWVGVWACLFEFVVFVGQVRAAQWACKDIKVRRSLVSGMWSLITRHTQIIFGALVVSSSSSHVSSSAFDSSVWEKLVEWE